MKNTGKKLIASICALIFALSLTAAGAFAWFGESDCVAQTEGSFAAVSVQIAVKQSGSKATVYYARSETDSAGAVMELKGGVFYDFTVQNFGAGEVEAALGAGVGLSVSGVEPGGYVSVSGEGGRATFSVMADEDCLLTVTVTAVG